MMKCKILGRINLFQKGHLPGEHKGLLKIHDGLKDAERRLSIESMTLPMVYFFLMKGVF